eukprot:COSAG02_NODE_751_length_17653_cov_172.765011_3_plen_307_part_00
MGAVRRNCNHRIVLASFQFLDIAFLNVKQHCARIKISGRQVLRAMASQSTRRQMESCSSRLTCGNCGRRSTNNDNFVDNHSLLLGGLSSPLVSVRTKMLPTALELVPPGIRGPLCPVASVEKPELFQAYSNALPARVLLATIVGPCSWRFATPESTQSTGRSATATSRPLLYTIFRLVNDVVATPSNLASNEYEIACAFALRKKKLALRFGINLVHTLPELATALYSVVCAHCSACGLPQHDNSTSYHCARGERIPTDLARGTPSPAPPSPPLFPPRATPVAAKEAIGEPVYIASSGVTERIPNTN